MKIKNMAKPSESEIQAFYYQFPFIPLDAKKRILHNKKYDIWKATNFIDKAMRERKENLWDDYPDSTEKQIDDVLKKTFYNSKDAKMLLDSRLPSSQFGRADSHKRTRKKKSSKASKTPDEPITPPCMSPPRSASSKKRKHTNGKKEEPPEKKKKMTLPFPCPNIANVAVLPVNTTLAMTGHIEAHSKSICWQC